MLQENLIRQSGDAELSDTGTVSIAMLSNGAC
jgi:hypothetical protein